MPHLFVNRLRKPRSALGGIASIVGPGSSSAVPVAPAVVVVKPDGHDEPAETEPEGDLTYLVGDGAASRGGEERDRHDECGPRQPEDPAICSVHGESVEKCNAVFADGSLRGARTLEVNRIEDYEPAEPIASDEG